MRKHVQGAKLAFWLERYCSLVKTFTIGLSNLLKLGGPHRMEASSLSIHLNEQSSIELETIDDIIAGGMRRRKNAQEQTMQSFVSWWAWSWPAAWTDREIVTGVEDE